MEAGYQESLGALMLHKRIYVPEPRRQNRIRRTAGAGTADIPGQPCCGQSFAVQHVRQEISELRPFASDLTPLSSDLGQHRQIDVSRLLILAGEEMNCQQSTSELELQPPSYSARFPERTGAGRRMSSVHLLFARPQEPAMPKPIPTLPRQSHRASQTKERPLDTIQAYRLVRAEAKTIRLSLRAVITHVGIQENHLCIWVREPVDALARKPRVFVTVPTWQSLSQPYIHIGTCNDGAHAWHILEVL